MKLHYHALHALDYTAGRWLWGQLACDVFNANDVLFSTASLLHLCCISIDRYIAIMDPFHYVTRVTVTRVSQMLAVTWSVSALVSHIPIHMGWWVYMHMSHTSPYIWAGGYTCTCHV